MTTERDGFAFDRPYGPRPGFTQGLSKEVSGNKNKLHAIIYMAGKKLTTFWRCTMGNLKSSRVVQLFIFLAILSLAHSAFSQFVVISTTPSNGATQVDPAGTIEIKFSAPLDTSARFDYPGQFYLHLLLYPDSLTGDPDLVAISPDLKTVSVHNLHLYPNTKYFLLIVDAVSTNNDSLAIPYLATFTTGNSLPTATVAGQVSFPQGDPQGTLVALLSHSPFSEQDAETESGAIVQTPAGDFTINYTQAGTFWPVALKDFTITADADVEPAEGGAIGFYDPNGDGEPDSIVVATGEHVAGINIELFSLPSVTARHNYPAVLGSAQNWAADAFLVQMGTNEISVSGQALIWMYAFYSPGLQLARGWMSFGEMVMPLELTEPPMDISPLPENWLDSDQIAVIAEAQGGAVFRSQHADAKASAFLGSLNMGGPLIVAGIKEKTIERTASGKAGTRFLRLPAPQRHQIKTSGSDAHGQLRMVDANPNPVWGFSYFSQSSGQQLFLLFDAVTGNPIQPPQPNATTARVNLNAAHQAAIAWAADAALLMVGNHASQITAEGEAMMWFFVFHSASLDSEQVFFLSEGNLLGQGQLGWSPPSQAPLPENWIDSNVAMAVAEANGGSQYRANDPDTAWVRGSVSYGLLPGMPDRVVWGFEYSSGYQAPLSIYVDAITGEFVTGPKQEITARGRLQEVKQQAQLWAGDATLIFVGPIAPVAPDGTCFAWAYAFRSVSQGGLRVFYAGGLGPISSEVPINPPPSILALPENWIDSNVAVGVVESQFGNFRQQHPDAIIQAMLSCGLLPLNQGRAIWKITYYSAADAAILIRDVDALTGDIVTGVEQDRAGANIPTGSALRQNYPNPFNPETTIEYELPASTEVELAVFNMMGQRVAVLAKGQQPAGTKRVVWNGRNEEGVPVISGVYLCSLKAGNFEEKRKMLLVR